MATDLLNPDRWNRETNYLPSAPIAAGAIVAGITGAAPVVANLLILPGHIFILGLVAQGALIGYLVGLIFRMTRTRTTSMLMAAILLATASSTLVVFSLLYAASACAFAAERSGYMPSWSMLSVEALFRFSNQYLLPRTGYGGLIGFVIDEWRKPESFVVFYAIEVFVIFLAGNAFARMQISKPFCEPCNQWMDKAQPIAILPAAATESLIAAVLASDVAMAAALQQQEADADLTAGCVRVYASRCPDCRSIKVDVALTVYGAQSSRVTVLMHHQPISEQFFESLRGR